MPEPPVIPVHIIYDDSATLINESRFFRELRELAGKLAVNAPRCRLSVIRAGRILSSLSDPKTFRDSISESGGYRVDLRGAFERIVWDYNGSPGYTSPEVLLLLGSWPAGDWKVGWQKLEPYRALILTYWISRKHLTAREEKELVGLLSQISPSDKQGGPRHRIVKPPESDDPQCLDTIVTNLEKRIMMRQAQPQMLPVQRKGTVVQPVPRFQSSTIGPGKSSPVPSPASASPKPAAAESPLPPAQEAKVTLNDTQSMSGNVQSEASDKPVATGEQVEGPGAKPEETALRANEPSGGAPQPEVTGQEMTKQDGQAQATSPPPSPQPAKWEVKEPPPDPQDGTSHVATDSCGDRAQGWYMVGASRRGRLHEHEGTFREDAFAIEAAAGWWLVAVADGAGSHHLSRVGSKVAVKTAVQAMVNRVKKTPPLDVTARVALQEALKCAWKALYDEAQKREVNFKDLSTTLLLLAYHPGNNLVGVAQIGDGLLAAQLEDSNIALLGQPESGEYSGETVFLTNHKFAELESKVETPEPPGPLKLLFVMTDGVADDLYPPQDRLPVLIEPMPEVLAADDPKQALLELINYPRTGSFDDRTLVVLCQPEKLLKAAGATAVVTQPEESAPSEPKSETEQQASEQPIGEEMATAAETSVQGAEREAD